MSANPTLRIDELDFAYEGGTGPVLHQVTSSLPLGQVVAVIGGQGCGKTTLLRAVAGSLAAIYAGTLTGRVLLDPGVDAPPRPLTGDEVSSFFDSYVQVTLSAENVAEEIALPLLARGTPEDERSRMAARTADELRIPHLLERPTTALSGGEEKLVGLAAAFCAPSLVYVLDEPFEQLDVHHLLAVIKAIKDRARAGSLVLVATGALDIALNIADTLLLSDGATWRTDGSPSYRSLSESGATLGVSQVLAFLGAAPQERLADIHSFRDAVVCRISA